MDIVDPGEREGLFRLAAAVIASGVGDRRFLDGDGLRGWCVLAGADPVAVRCGIRQALARTTHGAADGVGQPVRLYRPRPPIERHATAANGR